MLIHKLFLIYIRKTVPDYIPQQWHNNLLSFTFIKFIFIFHVKNSHQFFIVQWQSAIPLQELKLISWQTTETNTLEFFPSKTVTFITNYMNTLVPNLRRCNGSVSLLPCCIPYLGFDSLPIHLIQGAKKEKKKVNLSQSFKCFKTWGRKLNMSATWIYTQNSKNNLLNL
jgi:hypothetical protein